MKSAKSPGVKRAGFTLGAGLALLPAWAAIAAVVPAGTELAVRQEVVRNNGSEPASLDPHRVESDVEFNIISDFFDGLIGIDNHGGVEPRLAVSWDNTRPEIWTFHLRPGIRWSNGQPITAGDVVYSWRRLIDPATASPYESYLASMHVLNAAEIIAGKKPVDSLGVRALDDTTLQITLTQPVSAFLSMLAHPSLVAINPKVIAQFGDKWTAPQNFVGSGAFTLSQWVVNEKVVGVRNGRYWDNPHTVLNQITYLPIVSETADMNRYKAGEIDISNSVPQTLFRALQNDLGAQVHISPKLAVYYYQFNTKKPPFNDPRVRLALNMGLDKTIIAEKVLGQGQKPAYLFNPDNTGGFTLNYPDYAGWTQQQRVIEAGKLLAQAGFTPARPLKFSLLYNTNESHQRIAIAASSMWKKNLGVEATLNSQEWKSMLDTMHGPNFDVVRYAWIADYNEPSTFLNNYITNDSNNTAKYGNADYDRALSSAAAASSIADKARYYQQAEDILAKESPAIPIYQYVSVKLVKPYIGGFQESLLGYVYARDLYVIKH
ncbi:ABC transporter substrate-binding protein [Acerihabitans arboris]|uniref:Oligopeptide ABC transporter substrate-binding protein OppA n=1 Tax=Acerihabitans arboris TaxID=2691583 RepID=A0A845SKD5_9GAMM|nr:ABC transporter substrate-binding protein [Acerihabitans arboris]NDL63424.1 oligopeptide ABC transporter substrate-binding protein OppA [Acerihabitans arboris]